MTAVLSFTAPPTLAQFMQSEAFVRIVLGPVGSGKSTACLMELIRRMSEQAPAQDGIRHTRFAIVRQTLQQIKQTVLKEFYTWLDPVVHFKVSDNTVYIKFADIDCEVHLLPLDEENDVRRLLSMQLTGVWINEITEVDPGIVPGICGRLGRYPSAAMGGCSWFGLIADGNFPNEGGDWWELFEVNQPVDWQLFRQPGGRSPAAENVENLPGKREYYERLARGHSEAWVKRYVDAQYGPDPSGSAVFRESWKWDFHSADEVLPVMGHPLLIGQDFGRDPWSLICQVDGRGRLLVLEEVAAEDVGLQLHLARGLRPRLLDKRYLGRPLILVGDPAGRQRSSLSEETSFDLIKRSGYLAMPAPTNDIDARLRAVESLLLAQVGGAASLLVDRRRCPVLVRALNGGYRFQHMKSGMKKPTPDKNEFSHVADALQYVCLAAHAGWMAPTGFIGARMKGRYGGAAGALGGALGSAAPPPPAQGWT